MSQPRTGGYDALVVLGEAGLSRLIGTSYLENVARSGLPFPQRLALDNGYELHLLTGLPRVEVARTGDIGIVLVIPFMDSAQLPLAAGASFYGLNGEFRIVVPLDGVGDDGDFGFRLSALTVTVAPAEDDAGSDPNDPRPSSERWAVPAALASGVLTTRWRADPPGELVMLHEHPALAFLFGPGRCPVMSTGALSPPIPVMMPPALSDFRCLDPELIQAPADPGLLLKAKLSGRSFDTGDVLPPGQAPVDWITDGTEIGFTIGNRFLLDEVLPPPLLDFLLQIDRTQLWEDTEDAVNDDADFEDTVRAEIRAGLGEELGEDGTMSETAVDREVRRRFKRRIARRRRTETARRFEETLASRVAPFFAYPLDQLVAFGMRLPLPTLAAVIADPQSPATTTLGPDDPPNVTVVSTEASIPPGSNWISIRLALDITMPDYQFTATVEIRLLFQHQRGELRIVPYVTTFEIDWTGLSSLLASGLAGVIGSILVVGLSKVLTEPIAASAVQDVTSESIGGIRFRDLSDMVLARQVFLDDLQVQGAFRIGNEPSGRRGVVVEDATIASQETLEPTVTSLELSMRPLEPAAVVVENGQVKPLGGTVIRSLGTQPRWRAGNLCQADLRAASFATAFGVQPVSLPPIDLMSGPEEVDVTAVAVRSQSGQHALLLAHHDITGRICADWRVYRQLDPGLLLVMRPLQDAWAYPLATEAFYADPSSVPSSYPTNCEPDLSKSWSESIGIPQLVGSGEAVLGSMSVGVDARVCTFATTAVAVPALLRQPLSDYAWSVISHNGAEVPVPAGAPVEIDVAPPGGGTHQVTFRIDGEHPNLCHMEGQQGGSVDCRLKVTLRERNHAGHPSVSIEHEATRPILFTGKTIKSFGFSRWLDAFDFAMRFLTAAERDLGPTGHDIDPPRWDAAVTVGIPFEEMLRRDPLGERGILSRDLRQTDVGPAALYDERAKSFLETYVRKAFDALPRADRRRADIALFERRATAFLHRLPDPARSRGAVGDPGARPGRGG